MKRLIIIFIAMLYISCRTKIEEPIDLLEANIDVTTKEKKWTDLNTYTMSFEIERKIGDSIIGIQKKRVYNKLPFYQREEQYKNDSLEYLSISNEKGGIFVKFINGNFNGSTKLSGKNISPNPLLSLRKNVNRLVLVDSIWNGDSVYFLKDSISEIQYIFDKNSFLLLGSYEPSEYGRALRTYRDYKWQEGYLFPYIEDYFIKKAGFRMTSKYSSYIVNPIFNDDLFKIEPEWLALVAGDKIPDFELPLINARNKSIKLRDIPAKIILIDFWATWCKPCIAELPYMRNAYDDFKAKGFEILSVSLDTDESRLTKFLDEKEFPWISTHPSGGFESEIAKQFQVISLPKPIVVDYDGFILATDIEARGEKLKRLLASKLN